MRQLDSRGKEMLRRRLLGIMRHGLPPLTHVSVPRSIEEPWFKAAGLRETLTIYAFEGGRIRAGNGKTAPALKAWLIDEEAGHFNNCPMVIGSTSGGWGTSSGLIAPMFNVQGFQAVVGEDVPNGKLTHLQSSGAQIVRAPEGVSPIEHARKLGAQRGYHLIDQYVHPGTYEGHQWTMSHIATELTKLRLIPSVFGAVTGTCGTLIGANLYLKSTWPNIDIWGVASMSKAEDVPGSRYPQKLAALKEIGGFSYENVINGPLIASVTRDRAFRLNAELLQEQYLSVGPTSALLVAGFFDRLRESYEQSRLDSLRNSSGQIVAVLFFMDMHLPYLEDPNYLGYFET